MGAVGGVFGLQGGYGLSDAFRIYANVDYGLGVLTASPGSLRHHGSLSFGIAYTLDVISVLPWFGIGLQTSLLATTAAVEWVPFAEARGGVDWLLRRWFGLTAQLAYGLAFANRHLLSDCFTATIGLRFTADL